jgi:hypothetical protein
VLDGGVAVVVADLAEVESPADVDFEKDGLVSHDPNATLRTVLRKLKALLGQ